MIANSAELQVSARNLKIMEETLLALRKQLESTNPTLFETTAKAYRRRIEELQKDIASYVAEHPTAVSLLLPPLGEVTSPSPSLPSVR